jgi:retron-type reverse transcriptase
MDLAERVQRNRKPLVARPVKRVYLPKKQGSAKLRPLGIPVIVDRVHQARVVNALEPEWEARFEPKSNGFRPGRGCHDAIEAIYHVANGKSPPRGLAFKWAIYSHANRPKRWIVKRRVLSYPTGTCLRCHSRGTHAGTCPASEVCCSCMARRARMPR